jgi:thiol-disulfide isomerase/thioredoxin
LQKTFQEYGEEIKIIAVNIDINDSLEAIEAIKDEYSLTAPIAIDGSGKLSQAVNMIGTPYHILIDVEGNIVFKGHEASEQLDKTIKSLATSEASSFSVLPVEKAIDKPKIADVSKNKHVALFFTSTWCDWYLKDARKEMSINCINAQKQINALNKKHPGLNMTGIVSRLWTGDKELSEYKNKYNIEYYLAIDTNNQEFMKYNVKYYPTLILLHNGEEVFRTSDFSDSSKVSSMVADFIGLRRVRRVPGPRRL